MSKLLDAIQIENFTPAQAKHLLKQAQYNECLTVAIPSEIPETEPTLIRVELENISVLTTYLSKPAKLTFKYGSKEISFITKISYDQFAKILKILPNEYLFKEVILHF
jgi:hypothetical protein